GDDDVPTPSGKSEGEGAAEATATAGDDSYAIGQVELHDRVGVKGPRPSILPDRHTSVAAQVR
ncbi:MAG: hypothetical protein ACI82G_002757, partial [Bradymonadia bacterium]